MANFPRKWRPRHVLTPGSRPGFRDEELKIQGLNDEIRKLEQNKVASSDLAITGATFGDVLVADTLGVFKPQKYVPRKFGVGLSANPTYQFEVADGQVDLHFTETASGGVNGLMINKSAAASGRVGLLISSGGVGQWETSQDTNGTFIIRNQPAALTCVRITSGGTLSVSGTALVSGNVGIGTASPAADLQVVRSAGGVLWIDDGAGRFLKLRSANSGSQSVNISSYSGLGLGGTDNAIDLWVGSNSRVGIGTTSPGGRLHLVGGDLLFGAVGGASAIVGLSSTDGNTRSRLDTTGDGGLFRLFDSSNSTILSLAAYPAMASYFLNDFAFGTDTPTSRLHVKGAGATSATSAFRATDSAGNVILFVRNDGRVGVGLTSLSAALHLQAGTSALAPLMLTSGTNLTTPAGGAIEYDGSHFYGTAGSTRYQLDNSGGNFDVLFDHFADANNTSGETDLYSDSIAAGQLANNGEKLVAVYAGTFTGAVSSTQQLKAYFGGTAIFDSGALSIGVATDSWDLKIVIIRESSSVVRCSATLTTNFATLSSYATYTRITSLTLANAQTMKVTGTAAGVGAAANQITASAGFIQFTPAA